MRPDQIARLQDLAESVGDAFLDAADPAMWNGAGQDPATMDPQTRGARNWDIKNANQAGSLMARVLDLRDRVSGGPPAGGETPDDGAEHDIGKYERQAKDLLAVINGNGKKRGAG